MLLKKNETMLQGVDTSDLAATKDFIAFKTENDKIDVNKLISIPTSLNSLKTKVDVRC